MSFRGHNGHYISANFEAELGIKQEGGVDDWEKWTIEYNKDGNAVIRC